MTVTSTERAALPAVPDRHPRTKGPRARLGSRVPARWRIAAWILLTTALTLLAVMLTMRSLLLNGAQTQAHQDINQELQEFRAFAAEGVDPTTAKPFSSIEKMLEIFLSRQSAAQGEVIVGSVGQRTLYTPTGALSSQNTGHDLPRDQALMDSIRTGTASSGIAQTSEGEMHWVRLPVVSGNETGHLIVGTYMGPRENEVAGTVLTIFFVSLGGLAVTAGIAWLVAGQILSPVREVRRVAEDISENDLTARVPVRGNDDISALAVTFNTMLDRLESAYRTQRAFVDDASHELRTPITVIRGHLELMEDNEADRARTLALVDDELARMGRIVSDLLLLAKVDRPGFAQPRRTDAATLLLDIEAKAQVLGQRGWPILEIAEGSVNVDAQRITQAVLQLATNACQYSPEDSTVSLGSRFEGEGSARHFTLWVSDRGRGVDEDEAARIFGRFHRGQAAQDTDRARPGAGLGLAIVRSIAEAHHGTAWVRSTQGNGATFGITVPSPVYDGEPALGGNVTLDGGPDVDATERLDQVKEHHK
ncbi:HAMP domain-containing histidine kinase [Arthrobacter sp. 31Y]|uniref:HAMP domain-containing histidine kinase n=1 Tax=Arthrobacter sp. 31Y TaxID=1115632 RepID=UPI00046691FA|nr:HAMP domain-containing histidine kinase [Arthrobacter sp. 31Y]